MPAAAVIVVAFYCCAYFWGTYSLGTYSIYVKFVGHNLKVADHHHTCSC
jgi:hypothetical protein